MGFARRGEAVTGAHSLDDLKVVYRALHKGLPRFPELMDGEFLLALQDFLHEEASKEGVDATDHAQWDEWLARTTNKDVRI